MQKPSTLWPPPTYEMTEAVHASLRDRLRSIVHSGTQPKSRPPTRPNSRPNSVHGGQGHGPGHGLSQNGHADPKEKGKGGIPDVGATVHVPPLGAKENQRVELKAQNGEKLVIDQQIHLYTQNSLLTHPLVSPALSYLGGLPPMLITAGDGEVLRDEVRVLSCVGINLLIDFLRLYIRMPCSRYIFIIQTDPHHIVHIKPLILINIRSQMRLRTCILPCGISRASMHPQRFTCKYTMVRVFLWSEGYPFTFWCIDAAHVLPILFFYTTAAKYCFRAIASFTKYVTNQDDEQMSGRTRGSSFFFSPKSTGVNSPNGEASANGGTMLNGDITEAPGELSPTEEKSSPKPRASTMKSKKSVKKPQRSNRGERLAGDPIVYSHSDVSYSWL